VSAATHVALDGSVVTISMEADLSLDPSSVGVFGVDGREQEFTAGSLKLGRWAAREVSGVTLTEAYSHQGGVLRVGSRTVRDTLHGDEDRVWVGVWEGKRSSLTTQIFNLSDSSQVVSLFDAFEIREPATPSAVILKPADASVVANGIPCVTKLAPGVGLIEVDRTTAQSQRLVPKHRGTPVSGGELFFDEKPPSFLLLGPVTITKIMPAHGVRHDDVATRLQTLRVSWTDPE
jgi:hypothetical protein